jgi:O-antigen/teichoic acid export membrane protein
MAAFPAFIGMAVVAPEVIEVLLGPTWEPSVILVQLLCLAGLRAAMTQFVPGAVVSTGDAALQLRTTLIGVTVKITCVVVGLQFGVDGVAVAVVVSSYVTLPITFYALRKATDLTAASFLRQTVRPAVAAAVMALAITACRLALDGRLPAVGILALCTVVGAVAYVGALAVVGPAQLAEARDTLRQLRSRRPASGRRTTAAGAT